MSNKRAKRVKPTKKLHPSARPMAQAMMARAVSIMQPIAEDMASARLEKNQRTPTAEELVTMRLFVERYRKKNPLATAAQVERAVAFHFNLTIVDEE